MVRIILGFRKHRCSFSTSLDIGASELIINGKIKLKNDSPILEFHESGLTFADGSHIDADVVICATG